MIAERADATPNHRRMIRVTRLLYELGHIDVLDALEELKQLRAGPWIGKCQNCGHEHEAPKAER